MSTFWLEQGVVRHHIPEGESLLGRSGPVTIRVEDRKISRSHARLRRRGAHITIEDLGSSNGTWLNAQRVEGERELMVGDVLSLGDSTLRLATSEEEPPASVSLGVELIERRVEVPPPPSTPHVTDPHLSTVAIIEALVVSPAAESAPARVAGHVRTAVDRLLQGLEARSQSLAWEDADRVDQIIRRVVQLEPSQAAWAAGARELLEAVRE